MLVAGGAQSPAPPSWRAQHRDIRLDTSWLHSRVPRRLRLTLLKLCHMFLDFLQEPVGPGCLLRVHFSDGEANVHERVLTNRSVAGILQATLSARPPEVEPRHPSPLRVSDV